ncbi:hypothetical protein SS50377_22329 [Spironucleus salmonicida]|uniref:Uncharacterized protein n=1 Tax=Spironucleus salmonicida TaxID=348837 RepID=V6LCK6_9EUKA|nr:hypothetical protein SS50377_22329 [Spironucleus salmonicida]|eukprot:EST42177.1 Hypothetical protein SS50377_18483 [Spironucleus salmonicida]
MDQNIMDAEGILEVEEESQNRDQLFKIYYSEKMKKQLKIQEDCNEITYKEILQLSNHYKQKRQYWNTQTTASASIRHLDLKAITLNTVFLPKEQVQQAQQQQKYITKLNKNKSSPVSRFNKHFITNSQRQLQQIQRDSFQFLTSNDLACHVEEQ